MKSLLPNLTPLGEGWTWKERVLELLFWPVGLLLAPVIWVLSGNLLDLVLESWNKVVTLHDNRMMNKRNKKNREPHS